MSARPRIAIGTCFMHADPERALFKGKTLLYTEQKMARAVWRAGGMPMAHMPIPEASQESVELWLDACDGLLLQGGSDVAPGSYGERPIDERWPGDAVRDAYEIQLVRAAEARGLPILGLCRGAQILNVACGGSMFQDINTQVPGTLVHRDWEHYDELEHTVELVEDSWLAEVYGRTEILANSVHHQAINKCAPGFRVTALAPDGIIEAIERTEDPARWAVGVQWHPEWLDDGEPLNQHRSRGDEIFSAWLQRCTPASSR